MLYRIRLYINLTRLHSILMYVLKEPLIHVNVLSKPEELQEWLYKTWSAAELTLALVIHHLQK